MLNFDLYRFRSALFYFSGNFKGLMVKLEDFWAGFFNFKGSAFFGMLVKIVLIHGHTTRRELEFGIRLGDFSQTGPNFG